MGDGGAVDGLRAGREQRVCSMAQRGSGGADIIDEQYALATHPSVGRETPPGKLHSPDPSVAGLPVKTVAAKDGLKRSVDGRRHLGANETSCTEATA